MSERTPRRNLILVALAIVGGVLLVVATACGAVALYMLIRQLSR